MVSDYQQLPGQSKKSWCRDHDICEKSFYYWQRILRNETYIEMKQLLVQAPVLQNPERSVAFVELKPTPAEPEIHSSFQPDIILRSGQFVLEISNTASFELPDHLGGLLHAE